MHEQEDSNHHLEPPATAIAVVASDAFCRRSGAALGHGHLSPSRRGRRGSRCAHEARRHVTAVGQWLAVWPDTWPETCGTCAFRQGPGQVDAGLHAGEAGLAVRGARAWLGGGGTPNLVSRPASCSCQRHTLACAAAPAAPVRYPPQCHKLGSEIGLDRASSRRRTPVSAALQQRVAAALALPS